MIRAIFSLLIMGSLLLAAEVLPAQTQAPDGTVKITSRNVAQGVGLSWGDGVLTYKGRDYPFTFKATGLFREVDTKMTAKELSGQVFNLKNAEDFSGTYQKAESESSASGAGMRATIKNQKGVIVNLASTGEGRKFNLSREGLIVELKK